MRAVFFGLGLVGQRHLRNLRELLPTIEVAALRTTARTFEISDTLQVNHDVDIVQKFGIRTLKTMVDVAAFQPDFAIVANPSHLHYETCKSLLELKIPVFLEKPAIVDGQSAQELAAFAEKMAVPVQVVLQLRTHPCVMKVKEWIDSGRIGRLAGAAISVHSYMPEWHVYDDLADVYAARKDCGGGVVLTEIHEIDLAAWFFGRPRSVVAFASQASGLALNVEERIAAILIQDLGSGPVPVTLNMSFVQKPISRTFSIHGTGGVITLNIPQDYCQIEFNGHSVESFKLNTFVRNQMFKNLLSEFLECLRTGREPSTSIRRCVDAHETALAIKQSLKSGTQIFLPT